MSTGCTKPIPCDTLSTTEIKLGFTVDSSADRPDLPSVSAAVTTVTSETIPSKLPTTSLRSEFSTAMSRISEGEEAAFANLFCSPRSLKTRHYDTLLIREDTTKYVVSDVMRFAVFQNLPDGTSEISAAVAIGNLYESCVVHVFHEMLTALSMYRTECAKTGTLDPPLHSPIAAAVHNPVSRSPEAEFAIECALFQSNMIPTSAFGSTAQVWSKNMSPGYTSFVMTQFGNESSSTVVNDVRVIYPNMLAFALPRNFFSAPMARTALPLAPMQRASFETRSYCTRHLDEPACALIAGEDLFGSFRSFSPGTALPTWFGSQFAPVRKPKGRSLMELNLSPGGAPSFFEIARTIFGVLGDKFINIIPANDSVIPGFLSDKHDVATLINFIFSSHPSFVDNKREIDQLIGITAIVNSAWFILLGAVAFQSQNTLLKACYYRFRLYHMRLFIQYTASAQDAHVAIAGILAQAEAIIPNLTQFAYMTFQDYVLAWGAAARIIGAPNVLNVNWPNYAAMFAGGAPFSLHAWNAPYAFAHYARLQANEITVWPGNTNCMPAAFNNVRGKGKGAVLGAFIKGQTHDIANATWLHFTSLCSSFPGQLLLNLLMAPHHPDWLTCRHPTAPAAVAPMVSFSFHFVPLSKASAILIVDQRVIASASLFNELHDTSIILRNFKYVLDQLMRARMDRQFAAAFINDLDLRMVSKPFPGDIAPLLTFTDHVGAVQTPPPADFHDLMLRVSNITDHYISICRILRESGDVTIIPAVANKVTAENLDSRLVGIFSKFYHELIVGPAVWRRPNDDCHSCHEFTVHRTHPIDPKKEVGLICYEGEHLAVPDILYLRLIRLTLDGKVHLIPAALHQEMAVQPRPLLEFNDFLIYYQQLLMRKIDHATPEALWALTVTYLVTHYECLHLIHSLVRQSASFVLHTGLLMNYFNRHHAFGLKQQRIVLIHSVVNNLRLCMPRREVFLQMQPQGPRASDILTLCAQSRLEEGTVFNGTRMIDLQVTQLITDLLRYERRDTPAFYCRLDLIHQFSHIEDVAMSPDHESGVTCDIPMFFMHLEEQSSGAYNIPFMTSGPTIFRGTSYPSSLSQLGMDVYYCPTTVRSRPCSLSRQINGGFLPIVASKVLTDIDRQATAVRMSATIATATGNHAADLIWMLTHVTVGEHMISDIPQQPNTYVDVSPYLTAISPASLSTFSPTDDGLVGRNLALHRIFHSSPALQCSAGITRPWGSSLTRPEPIKRLEFTNINCSSFD